MQLILVFSIRKYITFPPPRYLSLRWRMRDITLALDDVVLHKDVKFVEHLGSNIFVGVKSPYQGVSIRQWFRPGGNINKELVPGYGVFLKKADWSTLVETDSIINNFIPTLKDMERCIDTHHGRLSFIACPACNPDRLYYDCL